MKAGGKKAPRPMSRVHHVDGDGHPVDEAIERRLPQRALRHRVDRATARLEAALGKRREVWLELEEPLNELYDHRQAAYFDLGFEHGFAAGRRDARTKAPRVRELAEQVRDVAIQRSASREEALAALLEAATSLAIGGKPGGSAVRRTRVSSGRRPPR